MRILLCGGGTAGHVWPIILIGRSLVKNKRAQILYVGSRQGIERQMLKDQPIPSKFILAGKRRSYFSFSNIWDIFKTFIGIIQAFFIISFFRPEVIFAKGGYVTFPIIFWLNFFKIPLVIHESDTVIGRANMLATKKAAKICLGFPIENYKENLSLDKLVYTGIPVSADFLQTPIKMGSRLKLLITGGSQGASKINNCIAQILPELLQKYDVFHVAGKNDYEILKKSDSAKEATYHLFDFTDQMPRLMRDADLIISRAGASTLAEISATAKPAIIIPLKIAAAEHQSANAEIYQKNNAAVVLSEENLTPTSLLSIIENLMADESLRKLIGHHARAFFQKEAANEIIDQIFMAVKNK